MATLQYKKYKIVLIPLFPIALQRKPVSVRVVFIITIIIINEWCNDIALVRQEKKRDIALGRRVSA